MLPNQATPSDLEILRAVAGGNGAAFMALYDRYEAIAFSLARQVLDDDAAGEDVVRDAFIQAWNRAGALMDHGDANPAGWLLAIVHHCALDVRHQGARPGERIITLDQRLELRGFGDVRDELTRFPTAGEMRAAIDDLPDHQRRAIELAYFGGLTDAEIAAKEGMPRGTVAGHLRLGLSRLRAALTVSGHAAPHER